MFAHRIEGTQCDVVSAKKSRERILSNNHMPQLRILHIVESLDRGAVENWLIRMLGHARKRGIGVDWSFYCVQEWRSSKHFGNCIPVPFLPR